MTPSGAGARPRFREETLYFLEILALTAFAVAQPLLEPFGNSPETFVFSGAGAWAIVAFALILCLGPPLAVEAIAAVANAFGRDARRNTQIVVVGALFALLLLVYVKEIFDLRGFGLALVALAGGVAFAVIYQRAVAVRSWLRFASAAAVVFALVFLFLSPVSDLLTAGRSAAAATGSADVPVVLLVLDELPTSALMRTDGSLDSELFPGFAELAADSTWYRNATTVSLRTYYAVPAILTGRFPRDDVVPVADTYPLNLFTFLGNSYDVDAQETLTRLCPSRICGNARGAGALGRLLGYARDVWGELSSPSGKKADPNESFVEEPAGGHETKAEADPRFDFNRGIRSTTPAHFERFLADIDGGKAASFDFLHLVLPHSPFQYYPSGVQYKDGGAPAGRDRGIKDTWTLNEGVVRLMRQRHLLQVQYVDTLVSRMIDRLRAEGLYDRALVIVTADHGIAFRPGESSRGGDKDTVQPSWPEMTFVPLFVKAPHQRGGAVSDASVRTVDILPTVADYLGIDLPWKVDGRSVRAAPRQGSNLVLYTSNAADGNERRGARHIVDLRKGEKATLADGVDTARGAGDPRWALYRDGPFPEIVGTRAADLAVAQSGGTMHLKFIKRFGAATPSAGEAPGLIFGRIADTSNMPVACAVNGTIGGVSPRFSKGKSDFGILPPDFLWHDGANDVDCYLVRAAEGRVELLPLTQR